MIKKKIIIEGPKVHDVGYRLFLLDEAENRLIPFLSVKNLRNKEQLVEVLVAGEEERVEKFIDFIKTNYPDEAEVEDVIVGDYEGDIRTIESFSRNFSISQLSKIARTGVAMLNLQSNMNGSLNKMDGTLDKMDGSLNSMNGRLTKMDGTLNKMDGTLNKIDNNLNEFRKETGENFRLLHSDNLKLQELMVKHDVETKELFRVVNMEISGIKERLSRLESAEA